MADHDIGDVVRLDATFTDEAGAAVDPATITFELTSPSSATTTYVHGTDVELVRDELGKFHVLAAPDAAGVWLYRWESTGVAQAAEEDSFYVRSTGAGRPGRAFPRPSVADVGALMRARTKTFGGEEPGTFTADTRPTGDQVQSLIEKAAGDVLSALEIDQVPERLREATRSLTALRAGLLVELSYWPEQVTADRGPYAQLKQLYDDGLKSLHAALRDAGDSTVDSATGMPAHTFPAACPLEW